MKDHSIYAHVAQGLLAAAVLGMLAIETVYPPAEYPVYLSRTIHPVWLMK